MANVDNVVVAPRFRGQGIAQRLLKALIEAGEAEQVEAFTLEVRDSNRPANIMWKRMIVQETV